MTEFQYDVPLPQAVHGKDGDKYGVKNFPMNASKFYPNLKRASPIHTCATRMNPNCKFVTRSVIENGVKGYRIWRIS